LSLYNASLPANKIKSALAVCGVDAAASTCFSSIALRGTRIFDTCSGVLIATISPPLSPPSGLIDYPIGSIIGIQVVSPVLNILSINCRNGNIQAASGTS